MVAKHFRIVRRDFRDKLQIRSVFCKDKFFFISYLPFLLVLAKIKWEAKLVRRGRVSAGDAAGGMDNFRNKSLPLVIFFCSPLYQLV